MPVLIVIIHMHSHIRHGHTEQKGEFNEILFIYLLLKTFYKLLVLQDPATIHYVFISVIV